MNMNLKIGQEIYHKNGTLEQLTTFFTHMNCITNPSPLIVSQIRFNQGESSHIVAKSACLATIPQTTQKRYYSLEWSLQNFF
jgi:hypothetical protein